MTQASERTELGLAPRLIAAGWFALAACIPIIFFFGVIGRMFFFGPTAATDPTVASILILLPVSMAAFFGFSIGSRILNEAIVTRGSRAAMYGALVAILSYFGFMLAYAAIVALNTPREFFDVVTSILGVLLIGAVLVGWLIVIAGAVSGWLLFRVGRNKFRRYLLGGPKGIDTLYLNVGAATLLAAILFVCWLPVLRQARREASEQSRRDLVDAVWRNDPSRVTELLDRGLSVETQDLAGSSLLLTAAEKGHTRIIRILLDHAANPNVSADRNGRRTPLLFAVVNADLESIRALLDQGANINTADAYGRTPLMEAAWATDSETVKLLIDRGADVKYTAPDGQTALSMAKLRRDNTPTKLDRSELTVNRQSPDAGENIIDSRDFQNPAIMKRARERHDRIIELLKSYGAK